jgi:outer membrane protein OmpA-like peptidoglycan-associated protein
MPSNDMPNQYNLFGENTPMWLVLGLLLMGTSGSIATAQLLLPPDMSIEVAKSWVFQSIINEYTSITSRTVKDTVDTPTETTSQNPTAESSRPIDRTPQSDNVDKSVSIESTTTTITQQALAVDTLPAEDSESSVSDKANDCAPLFYVQFQRGSSLPIDSNLKEKTTKLSEWLSRHPDTILLVEGHSDSSGPEEVNLLISHRRAVAVSQLLSNAGISDTQLTIRAFGEYAPLPGLPSESEKNRRVTLHVDGARACPNAISDGATQ